MQHAGKRIHPKLYYYDSTNTKVEIDHDDVENVKLSFNAPLTGSVATELTAELKVELPDTAIYFQNTATYNGTNATKTYGPFYLKESPSFNADSKTYNHTMYDGFLKTMVDYQPISITYPTTVLAFFQQLCLTCGYTTNITSLPNGSRSITMDIYDGINYTYRDVFDDIANATGSLFRCKNGVIEKCSLGISEIIVDDDLLKNQNIELGEHFGPINSIVLSRSGESDNIYKRDETLTRWNEYKIVDNQLMNDNNRSDYLDELYNTLYGIEYDIFDLELVGYGGFDPLTKITITTNNTTYNSYVFNNELTFTQGVEECIYTELPEESTTDYSAASTTDKKINQAYIITNKNALQIQSLVSQVGDRSEKTTSITQDIDTISQQVSESVTLTKEIAQNTSLTIEDAFEGDLLNFSIVGNMSLLYPSNDLYPSDDLYPLDSYLIIESEDGTQNKIHLPLTYLNYLNSEIYDEFVFEDGQAKIIRRVGVNDDDTLYALGTEVVEDKGELNIQLIAGYNKIWLESFYDVALQYYAKYVYDNDYTKVFATKVEMNSSITQTATEINLEVSKKVDEDEVIAAINLTSEETKINAGKITLEGIVTANENFKVLEDGSIVAVNGSFTGNIYLEDGNVVVGGDGLLSTMIVMGVVTTPQFVFPGSFAPMGDYWDGSHYYSKEKINFSFYIPDNFTVLNAYIYLQLKPSDNYYQIDGSMDFTTTTGYNRNLALYKGNLTSTSKLYYYPMGGLIGLNNVSYSQISGAWSGNNTVNGSSTSGVETKSIDIKSQITNGLNHLAIMSTGSSSGQTQNANYYSKVGAVLATLYIQGYSSLD